MFFLFLHFHHNPASKVNIFIDIFMMSSKFANCCAVGAKLQSIKPPWCHHGCDYYTRVLRVLSSAQYVCDIVHSSTKKALIRFTSKDKVYRWLGHLRRWPRF